MFRVLFYFPTIVMNTIHRFLPRRLFVATYKPSSETDRKVSQDIRNQLRRADYYAKRTLFGKN